MIFTSVLLVLLAHHCRSDLTLSVSRVGYPDINDPENNVTLRCTDAGTPVADANFTLNGTVIGLGVVQSYNQAIEEGIVRFVITQEEEGYYACEKDTKVSNETTLIAFLKDFSSAPEQNIMASEGTPFLFLCPYQSGALKEHYTIEWIYTSLNLGIIYTITGNEEQYEILEDYTLRLKNVSNEQSGTYRCRVISTTGMGVNPRIYDGPNIQFRIIQEISGGAGSEMENGSKMLSAKIIAIISTCSCVVSALIVTTVIYYFKVRRPHIKCKVNANTMNLERDPSFHKSSESITCSCSNPALATETQHEPAVSVMPPTQPSSSVTQLKSQNNENRNEEAHDHDSVTLVTDLLEPTELQEHSLPMEERRGSSTLDSKENVVGKEALQFSTPQNTKGNSPKYCSNLEFPSKSVASNAGVLPSPLSLVSLTRFSEAASRSASESVHTPSEVRSLTTGGLSYMSKSSIYSLEVVDYIEPDMPFFDPIEVIQCNSLGGRYTSQAHNVTVNIPNGAIPPGVNARIEFGVTLHGPFSFPANARPISPIIWLCIQQPELRFLKPIELKLPHYLDLPSEDSIQSLQLKYLKAPHDYDKAQTFHFCDTDGEVVFQPRSPYGIIHTQHFCYICLVADPQYDLTPSSYYYLMRVVPKPITSTAWDINFCVGHYLQTFIESVKRQYRGGREFKISSKKFKFKTEAGSEPKITIHFTRSPVGGWQLALESGSEIPAAEVDIWTTDPSHFDNELMMLNSYPPRFTIEVSGEGATNASGVEVSFTGVNDCPKLNTSLSLPLVNKTSHDIAPMPVPVQLHGLRNYSAPLMVPHYSYQAALNAQIVAGHQDPNKPTDEEFEKVVPEVIAKLRNNWNILQTFLGIPQNMQAEFDQEPTLRLKVLRSLQAWRALNHGQATRSKLAECIRKTDRSLHPIAHKLENDELT